MNNKNKIYSLILIFGIQLFMVLLINDTKANKLAYQYRTTINGMKNIKTKIIIVSAYEEHHSYNSLLRIPSHDIFIFFKGYKEKYEVNYIHSKALEEGAEFELKYVLVNNEECIISIASKIDPKLNVVMDTIPTSRHSNFCHILQ